MVLRNSGRVGSRRFRKENESRFNKMLSRLFSSYIFINNSLPLLGLFLFSMLHFWVSDFLYNFAYDEEYMNEMLSD